jgi:hypothetical protein
MAMAAYIIGMKKLQRSLLQEKELLSRDFWSSSRMTGKPYIDYPAPADLHQCLEFSPALACGLTIPRNHVRYNLQEWFSLEKLLDKRKQKNQIRKRVKRRICRPEQSRLGGQPNDRFIPEAVARRMFASLTLSSRRLS